KGDDQAVHSPRERHKRVFLHSGGIVAARSGTPGEVRQLISIADEALHGTQRLDYGSPAQGGRKIPEHPVTRLPRPEDEGLGGFLRDLVLEKRHEDLPW